MSAPDTRIAAYLARDVIANRPAAPSVPSTGSGFYYATDTAHLYIWSGGAWVQLF